MRGLELGTVPAVTIDRSGLKVIEHTISWGTYPEDELEVAVTASDPTVVVPGKLYLDFERHQFRFHYEVRAGDQAGEFTVTLRPKTGNVVQVKVIVK